jgi:O-antigen/teichoic acid export membrane protein
VFITLAVSGLLVHLIGSKGYGLYSLVILLPIMITRFTNFGIRQAIIYYAGRGDFSNRQIFGTSLIVMIILSFVSIIVGSIVVIWFRDILFQNVPVDLLWISIFGIPFLLFAEVIQGFYVGLQKFKKYNFITILPDLLLLFLLTTLSLMQVLSVSLVVIAYVVSRISIFYYIKDIFTAIWIPNSEYFRSAVSYSIKSHLGNLTAFLNYRIDQFLVNFYLGPALLGVYAAAVVLSEGISLISGGVSTVLLPRIAELKDDPELQKEITPLVTRHVFVIFLILTVLLLILSKWIVNILYFGKLPGADLALRLLLPGILMLSISRILAADIAARGYPEINLYTGAGSLIINVLSNVILIPRLGVPGAAISSSISYTFNTILKIIIYLRMSGVRLSTVFFIQPSDILRVRKLVQSLALFVS